MKNKLFVAVLVFSIAFVSCKDEKKPTEAEKPAAKEVVKEQFSVELDVISKKKDDFAVYFTEDGSINFVGEKAIWRGVEPKEEIQKVVIDLPEEVLPTNIRIDFGINKEQDDIVLEKFKLTFFEKSFEAKGSEFFKYFIPNESIKTKIDEAKGTITFLKNTEKYSVPFFYPQQAVLDEIKKLTN